MSGDAPDLTKKQWELFAEFENAIKDGWTNPMLYLRIAEKYSQLTQLKADNAKLREGLRDIKWGHSLSVNTQDKIGTLLEQTSQSPNKL